MKYFIGLTILLFSFAFWFYQKNQNELENVANQDEVVQTINNKKISNLNPTIHSIEQSKNPQIYDASKIAPLESEQSNQDVGYEISDYPVEEPEYVNNVDVGPNDIYTSNEPATVVDDANDRSPANE